MKDFDKVFGPGRTAHFVWPDPAPPVLKRLPEFCGPEPEPVNLVGPSKKFETKRRVRVGLGRVSEETGSGFSRNIRIALWFYNSAYWHPRFFSAP